MLCRENAQQKLKKKERNAVLLVFHCYWVLHSCLVLSWCLRPRNEPDPSAGGQHLIKKAVLENTNSWRNDISNRVLCITQHCPERDLILLAPRIRFIPYSITFLAHFLLSAWSLNFVRWYWFFSREVIVLKFPVVNWHRLIHLNS